MIDFLFGALKLINDFIMGDFKWTLLGVLLLASGQVFSLALKKIFPKVFQNKWVFTIVSLIIICVFIYFGHEYIFDPMFHRWEASWTAPLGEPMHIITPTPTGNF